MLAWLPSTLSMHRRAASRRALTGLLMLALAGCRLVVVTDDRGTIVSASGAFDCQAASCAFEITEKTTDTFTATPAEGYRFVRWLGLCARSPVAVCEATLAPLPAELAHFAGDIELAAEFESLDTARAWYRDADGDHFGTTAVSVVSPRQPEGFVISDGDCDDRSAAVKPWAKEREDGVDNNCNGIVDEGFVASLYYRDEDGDGFGDPAVSRWSRRKPSGYVPNDRDCDDAVAQDNPAASEALDGRDNDCDGSVDEGSATYYRDVDGDGFGGSVGAIQSLEPPAGYVSSSDDCDDNNSQIHPTAEEQFDSVDNDCDGLVDEGFTVRIYYRDRDSDGLGDPEDAVEDVIRPTGYADNAGDNCPAIYNPGQEDRDGDGLGDACDAVDDRDPGSNGGDGGDGDGKCTLSADDRAMLEAVNSLRAEARECGSRGLLPAAAPLSWSCELTAAALSHATDMATNDFFSHEGSDGSSMGDRATREGYAWSALGENVAGGSAYNSVSAVLQGWIKSPDHCANLMGARYQHLGAARFSNPASRYGIYWTQMFGTPR